MAESVTNFAARVKAKYPGYANVPDEDLARRIVDKYPEYADSVTFEQPPTLMSRGQELLNKGAEAIGGMFQSEPAESTRVDIGQPQALPPTDEEVIVTSQRPIAPEPQPIITPTPEEEEFYLLLENGDYLLKEDGGRIILG